jgi:hypothetical protein
MTIGYRLLELFGGDDRIYEGCVLTISIMGTRGVAHTDVA